MPVSITKKDGYQVRTPGGVKAKSTSAAKAAAQARLLRGVEHGWKPTGKKGKKISKEAVRSIAMKQRAKKKKKK